MNCRPCNLVLTLIRSSSEPQQTTKSFVCNFIFPTVMALVYLIFFPWRKIENMIFPSTLLRLRLRLNIRSTEMLLLIVESTCCATFFLFPLPVLNRVNVLCKHFSLCEFSSSCLSWYRLCTCNVWKTMSVFVVDIFSQIVQTQADILT